ncbi:hypothetical protein BH09MYX1_BH09MYX1_58040 [soil metagenome]
MMRFRARFTLALVLALALLVPRVLHADDPPPAPALLPQRSSTLTWDRQVPPVVPKEITLLKTSLAFRDVLDPALTNKLASGLPTVIAMRAYVFEERRDEPVALAVRSCRVTYDLWDEIYRIKITGPGGDRDAAAINADGVLRQCAEIKDFPVVDRALLKSGTTYFLGVIVDVNPVSPQMLEQMRRWVSRPTGSTNIGPSDALFGSFVGLFIRQIGQSDRTLRFRTTSFTVP